MSLMCLDVSAREMAKEDHDSHCAQMIVLSGILPSLQLVHLISKGLEDNLPETSNTEQDFR